MKRMHGVCLFVALFVCTATSPLWAIWEGNAGIAASSQFPGSGFYARSDMFPKNTIIEIENLETGITVRAVITGPSGVSGLVAMLSPETASALEIKEGSVSRVRISIPSPVSEQAAPGTITRGSAVENTDPDMNPEAAVDSGLASQENPDRVLESVATPAEDPLVALEAPVAAAEAPVAAAEAPVAAAEAPVAAAEAPVAAAEAPVAAAEAPVAAAEAPVAAAEAPVAAAEAPVAAAEEPIAAAEEPIAAAPEVYTSAAAYDEPELAVAEPVQSAPNATEEVALVPAEMNPPPETVAVSEAAIEPAAVETVPAATVTSAPVVAAPVSAAGNRELPYISKLERGSYYVQIASYGDPVNAGSIVDRYAPKYPVSIEKTPGKNGDLLRVYIGPVGKDEYGAVLERFKSLGFKDAFVKKGQ